MGPLPLQEVVVAAVRSVGVLVAHAGARLVDRAAASLEVEEHARAAEDLVLVVTKDLLPVDHLCEAALRRLFVDAEVFRETFEVALLDDDAFVRAAVRGALRA